MLNSILMLGSCYNKNKKVSNVFTILMILNLVLVQINFMSIKFLMINLAIMMIISLGAKCIKNRHANNVVSILSIALWSILIDIISFYLFPLYSGATLIHYVSMGLLFNIKYVLINAGIIAFVEVLSYAFNKQKALRANLNLNTTK